MYLLASSTLLVGSVPMKAVNVGVRDEVRMNLSTQE